MGLAVHMIYERPHSYDIVVHNRTVLREAWLLQCTWFMCVSCMRYGAHGLCVAHGLCYVMLWYVMLCAQCCSAHGLCVYNVCVMVHMVYRCTWFMLCDVMFCVQCCSAHGLCVACALLFFARSAALAQWQSGIHTCPLRAVGPPPMPVRGQCGSPSALHRTPAIVFGWRTERCASLPMIEDGSSATSPPCSEHCTWNSGHTCVRVVGA